MLLSSPCTDPRIASILHPIELFVLAFAGQERRMRAFFHDPAADDNGNAIGTGNGGEPVGDHHSRTPVHQVLQCLLNDGLRLGIQGWWLHPESGWARL